MNFLTVPQVAEELDCSPDVVYAAIASGRLRAAKPGRKFLIRPEAVDAWLEADADERVSA